MKNQRSTRVAASLCLLVGMALSGAGPGSQAGAESTTGKMVVEPPPSVMVLGRKLVLKSTETSATEDLVAEYVPPAETLDHWTLMLGVRIFKGKMSPDQAVGMKQQEIAARRAQGDFMANSAAFAKGDVRVIDFVLSQSPIVEHNVMSFSKGRDGRLVSYQLARRYYQKSSEVDDGLRAFMGEIRTKRDTYVSEVERLSKDLLK